MRTVFLLLCWLLFLPTANALMWQTGSKQTITMAVGEDLDHGMVYANGKLWVALNVSPAKLARFNNPTVDLSDYTVVTWPNDGLHSFPRDVIYIPSKNKVYMSFLNATKMLIAEVDPVTLAKSDVISTNSATLSNSMCTDGTYFYLTATIAGKGALFKFALSNWAEIGRTNMSPLVGAYPARYDGSNIFICGDANPGWVAKVNPSSLSFSSVTFNAGEDSASDNPVFYGDDVWVGLMSNSSTLFKIRKSDLNVTRINTGITGGTYTMMVRGRFIWRAVGLDPGVLQRIDPITLDMQSLTLSAGEILPADLAFDSTYMYVATDDYPVKMIRMIVSDYLLSSKVTGLTVIRGTVTVR